MIKCRKFLELVGGIGAICLISVDKLVKGLPSAARKPVVPGELIDGFLLLDENASIPEFVKIEPSPILGEIEKGDIENSKVTDFRGDGTWFTDLDSMRQLLDFPLYTLDGGLEGTNFLKGYILRFSGSRKIWEATLYFGRDTSLEPVISISARPKFHQPYPVWPVVLCI